jgi:hypothetical protein
MSYNSVSDFKLRAFPSGSYNSIPNSVIQYNLDLGSSLINTALLPFHTLPLDTTTYNSASILTTIYDAEVTIASYKLMTYRGFKPNVEGTEDNVLRERYAEVMDPVNGLLANIRSGKILFTKMDATPTKSEKRMKLYGNTGRSIRVTDSDGKPLV